MNTAPAIRTLLDTDLYKYTMAAVIFHHFPTAVAEYRFHCRTPDIDFTACFPAIQNEVEKFCSLRLVESELSFLNNLGYFKQDFLEFLRGFRLNIRSVNLRLQGRSLELIIRGPWLHCILFEVPLLAIISECYFRQRYPMPDFQCGRDRLHHKIQQALDHPQADGFRFSDFGTRRRFSRAWHEEVVTTLRDRMPVQLVGTSNVELARRLGLKAVGTVAHEYLQACQALAPCFADSQKFALATWFNEYQGQLGIALTDVVGMDAFLRDFGDYANIYSGLRHDSGDPYQWAEKALAFYRDQNVDPHTKTLVFSDSLNFDLALAICERYRKATNPVFGIGTNLTNDLGYEKLDIVIKMTRCNDQPVAKISDSPGKTMCEDKAYLALLAEVFKLGDTIDDDRSINNSNS